MNSIFQNDTKLYTVFIWEGFKIMYVFFSELVLDRFYEYISPINFGYIKLIFSQVLLGICYSTVTEKEMATHSSVLALRIPGTGKPGWAGVYGVSQSWTRLKRLSNRSSSRVQ